MLRARVTQLGLRARPQRGGAEGFSHPLSGAAQRGGGVRLATEATPRGGGGERPVLRPVAGTAGTEVVYPPPRARQDLPAALPRKVPEGQARSPPARRGLAWPLPYHCRDSQLSGTSDGPLALKRVLEWTVGIEGKACLLYGIGGPI